MLAAPPEVDLPPEVGVGADQPRRDLFGRKEFDPLEVELVGQVGIKEVPDQLLDHQGEGEQELVGLVVSSGHRRSSRRDVGDWGLPAPSVELVNAVAGKSRTGVGALP